MEELALEKVVKIKFNGQHKLKVGPSVADDVYNMFPEWKTEGYTEHEIARHVTRASLNHYHEIKKVVDYLEKPKEITDPVTLKIIQRSKALECENFKELESSQLRRKYSK